MNDIKKYIFKCRLTDDPICIVYSIQNGFHAEALEQCGIWDRKDDYPHTGTMEWTAKYPLCIKYGNDRHDLEIGETFTLSG